MTVLHMIGILLWYLYFISWWLRSVCSYKDIILVVWIDFFVVYNWNVCWLKFTCTCICLLFWWMRPHLTHDLPISCVRSIEFVSNNNIKSYSRMIWTYIYCKCKMHCKSKLNTKLMQHLYIFTDINIQEQIFYRICPLTTRAGTCLVQ